jgi:hypothetical protein
MKWDKVEKLDIGAYKGGIEVAAYEQGAVMVVPNPLDRERVEMAEETYRLGWYASKTYIYLRKEDFEAGENWK